MKKYESYPINKQREYESDKNNNIHNEMSESMKTKIVMTLFIAAIASLAIVPVAALANDDTFVEISSEELKALMDTPQGIFLINPLSDLEFSLEHIPGSINIPLHMIPTTTKLPTDKNTIIVTYCKGRK